eukprot:CAMPEP_0179838704 /NCGR_PEP_ID=MMETSP0982-20121206/856_1 /TAXON_ID=483367 /ORGANISM="non described non described, Strain CCMP 2436" /LENGTH=228 /DNA_ID=CAMNT_0021722169 /DNA_START=245 /DNA_END=932 /DNA_ORIENTATION=+
MSCVLAPFISPGWLQGARVDPPAVARRSVGRAHGWAMGAQDCRIDGHRQPGDDDQAADAVVTGFVATKASCVATDIDGNIVACTLVNTFKRVKDKALGAAGGLETMGELMKVKSSASGKAYVKQTTLGAMKLLKGVGTAEVRCSASTTDGDLITHLTSLGFIDAGRSGDFVTLSANLFAVNTDPGKKIEAAPVPRKVKAVTAPEPDAEAAAPAEAKAAEEVAEEVASA